MTCPLFIELCAGTAAVSLRLARARARPPVSRMGAKTGYADAILGLAGLAPGQGAGHYLWCEPDPGCRLLLEAYRDAALARAAADIIRGWAGEDPRALWERLRAEGPPRGPEVSPGGLPFAQEVARWACASYLSYGQDPQRGFRATAGGCWPDDPPDVRTQATRLAGLSALPATIAPDARQVDPREVARWAVVRAGTHPGGDGFRGLGSTDPRETGFRPHLPKLAVALDASGLPATIAPDARQVDPREVARVAFVQRLAGMGLPWGSYCDIMGQGGCDPRTGQRYAFNLSKNPIRLDSTPTLPATILPDAHAADPGPALPPGTVVLFDPPYQGTTPYAHDLPRADVVALARRWAAAGALVMVCEAEPIPELVADGWRACDIAHARRGQKRTFSRQQREVVTMSRPPVHVPAEQVGLFGGGR